MPELPDLEVFTVNLDRHLAGKVVRNVVAVNDKKLNVDLDVLQRSLQNQQLHKVYRVGKEVHFRFINENVLGLHLMLNGELYLDKEPGKRKNVIIELLFDDAGSLVMTDHRALANATLNPTAKNAPDALAEEVSFDFLKSKLAKKSKIKVLLLDQKVIGGIGNAYADEILWEARISPFSTCNKIPDDKIEALTVAIKKVLKDAITYIKKSHPGIITGEVRDFLKIHNSKKKQSPTGHDIKIDELNGRKTYYTDEQELFT